MNLFEQDYFVVRFADGTYRAASYNTLSSCGDISRAMKYLYLEDAKDAADDFNRYGPECEIIPIRVVITEIKKREILCYFMNPIFGNGWDLRVDESMRYYWKAIVTYDGFGALTD